MKRKTGYGVEEDGDEGGGQKLAHTLCTPMQALALCKDRSPQVENFC